MRPSREIRRITRLWPRLIETGSEFTQPVALTDGRKLVVFCSDDQVTHQLKQSELKLVERINHATEVHFVVAIDAIVVDRALLLLAQATFRLDADPE